MTDLIKYAREFLGHINAHRWEQTDDGSIWLPRARALIHGEYEHAVNGEDWQSDTNLIVDEGLVYLLQAAVTNDVADVTAWYLAPYGTNYTPVAGLTAATFASTTGELAGAPEGYSEGVRQTWTPDAVDTGNTEVTNDATPATFTMVTASTIDINGAGMLSVSTKSATSGTLLSASKFSATRTFSNGDEFNLKYKIDADAA